MKTVAIIGTNGLPAKYGGFETLANHLVENLDKSSYEIIIYCAKTPRKSRLKFYNGAKLIYFPFKANGWQSLVYDFLTILHAFFRASDLIILGFSGAFAFPLNKFFKKNIIFNIGGIEWKKVRGSKLTSRFEIVLKKYMERLCVTNSNTVIVDNLYFKDYILKTYKKMPVLAEYGGDHAKRIEVTNDMVRKYPFLNTNYALSVSRAQEDMNIHLLIEAYKEVPDKQIVIISNWHISDYGQKLFDENVDKNDNIILLEAIYDSKELDTIRSQMSLYIHTHSLCGTAPSLVEAMSLNIPIISFDVPTNRFTTEDKALFFSDVSSLVQILKNTKNNELSYIKDRMFEISLRRYSWKRISKIYQKYLS